MGGGSQAQTVRDITSLRQVGENYVRDLIHTFNERGFDALNAKPSGGTPPGGSVSGKVNFAVGSPIRTWTSYPARAA